MKKSHVSWSGGVLLMVGIILTVTSQTSALGLHHNTHQGQRRHARPNPHSPSLLADPWPRWPSFERSFLESDLLGLDFPVTFEDIDDFWNTGHGLSNQRGCCGQNSDKRSKTSIDNWQREQIDDYEAKYHKRKQQWEAEEAERKARWLKQLQTDKEQKIADEKRRRSLEEARQKQLTQQQRQQEWQKQQRQQQQQRRLQEQQQQQQQQQQRRLEEQQQQRRLQEQQEQQRRLQQQQQQRCGQYRQKQSQKFQRHQEEQTLQNLKKIQDLQSLDEMTSSVSLPHTEILALHVPGYSPNDIEIRTEDGLVQIRGRHQYSCGEIGGCYVREFERTYTLPEGVDTKSLKANVDKDGVLRLHGKNYHTPREQRTVLADTENCLARPSRDRPTTRVSEQQFNGDSETTTDKGSVFVNKDSSRTVERFNQDNSRPLNNHHTIEPEEGDDDDDGVTIEVVDY